MEHDMAPPSLAVPRSCGKSGVQRAAAGKYPDGCLPHPALVASPARAQRWS